MITTTYFCAIAGAPNSIAVALAIMTRAVFPKKLILYLSIWTCSVGLLLHMVKVRARLSVLLDNANGQSVINDFPTTAARSAMSLEN